ncbi:MAG: hypothetical protein WD069_16245 [Planctomycetales bacterium]
MSVERDPASEPDPRRPAAATSIPWVAALVRRHLAIGWWGLLVFLTLGIAIEGFHGFKTRWYADVGNELRRTMLRLAHAHGGMLAIVHLLFAGTLGLMRNATPRRMELASRFLTVALVLVPGGFLLGGFYLYETDPGLGVFLVPIGAAFLFAGVLLTALAQKANSEQGPGDRDESR